MLLGGIAHDLDHWGVSNQYYIKTSHFFAQVVNDQSVLENYHSYLFFFLLRKKDNNIVEHLNLQDYLRFRKVVIDCILGTDMSKHFAMLKSFDNLIA